MLDRINTSPWAEAIKEEITITRGFEKDIPLYVSEFISQHINELKQAVLSGNKDGIKLILATFTQSIPRETQSTTFEELFLGFFFTPEGKPHLSLVKGKRDQIVGDKVQAVDLDFPEAPTHTTGLILIHTHPKDSLICLSDPDITAFSEIFSQRLRLFPNLNNAYIGLCTATKPEKTLLFETESWGVVKYFSKESLRKKS